MNCEIFKELCWLEDEISEKDKHLLQDHFNTCKECAKEYDLKEKFFKEILDYKKLTAFENYHIKKTKKQWVNFKKISLVASFIVIALCVTTVLNPAFAKNMKNQVSAILNFITGNFGREYVESQGLTQIGPSVQTDNIKINIRSVAVSKSNISLIYTIEDILNKKDSCFPVDSWLEIDGEVFRFNGTVSNDLNKEIVWGDINFNLGNHQLPEEITLNVRDLEITKGFYDNPASQVKKVLKATWKIPIEIQKDLIDKANNYYVLYCYC